ncbi:MAG: hypothetical protein CVU81_01875 [Euryarchaeota archaeon HGW-Euryarchaeota-1]|nr:MAG: hypothetical protein CVU81_01875 [Euryarchaeota archaeon HGW-Euryarchaeota-1]
MLNALKTIHRVDFLITYIVILLIPAILARASLQDSLIIMSFVLLAFAFGNVINSYSDAKTDASNLRKKGIAEAVSDINFLKPLIIVEFFLVAASAIVLFGSKPLALIFGGSIAFLAIGYSLKPLRFKGRGVLHGISLLLSVYFLPLLFVYFALTEKIVWWFVGLILAYALFRSGISTINNVDDYFEDKKQGIKTTAVALGVKRTALIGLLLSILGVLGTLIIITMLGVSPILSALLAIPATLVLWQEWLVYKSSKKETKAGVKSSQEFFKRPNIVNLYDYVFLAICVVLHFRALV